MPPPPALSRGSVLALLSTRDTTSKPLLQVVDLKALPPASASASASQPRARQRYRLALSDGAHFLQAMLAAQLGTLVQADVLATNAVVRLQDFVVQEVVGKPVVVVLNLDVVETEAERVGRPVSAFEVMPKFGEAAGGEGGRKGIMAMAAPRQVGVGDAAFREIMALNPYQTGWTIKGRCTFKSEKRKFQNARGDGFVISFELTDESGSIRVTAFTHEAAFVDETVQVGGVYSVARAALKQANEKYNRSTSTFEMTLDARSVLKPVHDDGSVVPIKYCFVKIAELEKVEVKANCDVVAVVLHVGEVHEIFIRSTGEPCKKRSITLLDDSLATVELTLWRGMAETLVTEADVKRHPVIVLRNAVRGDFGGVCLNPQRSTAVELDPNNVPEVAALRAWYAAKGAHLVAAGAAFQSLSSRPGSGGRIVGGRKLLEEAKEEDVEGQLSGGASVTVVVRGYVVFISKERDLSYPSDPGTKKKVVEASPGIWHSESSGRDFTEDEIVHRYVFSAKIGDASGNQWMNTFDEGGVVIFGKEAGEMRALKANNDPSFESVVDACLFQPLVLKVIVKEETYNGETRIRYTISRCEKVDFVEESRKLLSEIATFDL